MMQAIALLVVAITLVMVGNRIGGALDRVAAAIRDMDD